MENKEMKAAILKDLEKIEVKEVKKPEVSEGEVLVRVKSCAICGLILEFIIMGTLGLNFRK